jgi:hypothetical protein
MNFSKSGNVITQTGGSSSNRDTPQDLINAGLAGVSSSVLLSLARLWNVF